MQTIIRPVTSTDVLFLWEMLYYAAHMAEEGARNAEPAIHDPYLNIYINGWGRAGDVGVIAYDGQTSRRLGAAWLRLIADKSNYGYYDDQTPELAIAVLPEVIGLGVGSTLLSNLIETVRGQIPAIVLTVRADNPAKHLYERHGFVVIDEVTNRVGTKSSKMLLRF